MWAARRLLPSWKGLTGTTTQRPRLLCALFVILVPGPVCRGVAVTKGLAELQDLCGEALFGGQVGHYGVGCEGREGQLGLFGAVLLVEDESVEEAGVVFDDGEREVVEMAHFAHHFGYGALDGAAADDGADGEHRRVAVLHELAQTGD